MASNEVSSGGPPQSPWKKPKIVSIAKSGSLKRKSSIMFGQNTSISSANASPLNNSCRFSLNDLENQTDSMGDSEKSAKNRRVGILNRFSINNSLNGQSPIPRTNSKLDNNHDLSNFFSGSRIEYSCEEKEALNESAKNAPQTPRTAESAIPSKVIFELGVYQKESPFGMDKKAESETAILKDEEKAYAFDSELLPLDWSLKTKCRFTSYNKFTCLDEIKPSHESEAMQNYAKFNSFYDSIDRIQFNSKSENNSLFKILFGESISYWIFPYLPWLQLYPKSVGGFNSTEPLNADIQLSLAKSWNTSFKSLYYSLRNNQCPYFYLLTPTFMVLFRAENIGGVAEMHAILTPSTKGLRESLKDITFTMPLMPNAATTTDNSANLNSESSTNNLDATDKISLHNEASNSNDEPSVKESCETESKKKEEEEDEDEDLDVNDDESEADEWLDNIGLSSTVNLKASVLQRNSRNAKKESMNLLDNRPRSTLLIQGGDVHGLFNFLLNDKICFASSGPMQGVPPTLIAPTTFIGATMQKLKVEKNLKKNLTSTGESLTQYTLDFTGPIMPYHLHRLSSLFVHTQKDEFEVILNVYQQSEAFNSIKLGSETPDGSSCEDSNSNSAHQSSMLNVSRLLDRSEKISMQRLVAINGKSDSFKTIIHKDGKFFCEESSTLNAKRS